MSDPLDSGGIDARILFSIGTKQPGTACRQFYYPRDLAFDIHRGLLFVTESYNHRVQVFSSDDGSFVSKFGEKGSQPSQMTHPDGIALDYDHDRIIVVLFGGQRVQSWSLSDQSFLSSTGRFGPGDLEFNHPRGIAIDKHHDRIIIVDSNNGRLVFLSSIDLSFLFSVGGKNQCLPSQLEHQTGIVIDHDRHRIIRGDNGDRTRVQVLSLIDGSFLFEFGSQGNQSGQFDNPQGICVDNHGRIIVADCYNYRLQAFTPEGHHISSFDCGSEGPFAVAFDEHRGLIAFTAGHQVHVIGANQWLPDTEFTWRPDSTSSSPIMDEANRLDDDDDSIGGR